MSDRVTDPIEKLARKICWLEFAEPPPVYTEVSYWRPLPKETKDAYALEARRFIWLCKQLGIDFPPHTKEEVR